MEDSDELTDPERDAEKLFSDIPAPFVGISAKKRRIHLEASRRLAAMGGTMPDLEYIRRLRVDDL
jgi:hypothetical protein